MAQPPDLSTLPLRVAYLRGLTGLDPWRLAQLAGLCPTAIYQIERGGPDRRLRPETRNKLVEITGAKPDWLDSNRGKPPGALRVTLAVGRACHAKGLVIVPGGIGLVPAMVPS